MPYDFDEEDSKMSPLAAILLSFLPFVIGVMLGVFLGHFLW